MLSASGKGDLVREDCLGADSEAADACQRQRVMPRDFTSLENSVVHRGVAVLHENDRESKRQSSSHGGVDAELALQTADDEFGDAEAAEHLLQLGVVERVGGP